MEDWNILFFSAPVLVPHPAALSFPIEFIFKLIVFLPIPSTAAALTYFFALFALYIRVADKRKRKKMFTLISNTNYQICTFSSSPAV